jgi:putative ATPase
VNVRLPARPPLAERMRPRALGEICGQEKALATFGPLLARGALPSLILWGPPGCGKTSFAAVAERAGAGGCLFKRISAVTCGVKEIREVVDGAAGALRLTGRRTILFVDEIHRFNKSQQDTFLPHVEQGTITLLGATTENPSFSLNSALLSRCRVVTLAQLGAAELAALLQRAVADAERGLGDAGVAVPAEVLAALAALADGDARVALNALELAVSTVVAAWGEGGAAGEAGKAAEAAPRVLTVAAVEQALQKSQLLYDRAGEQHYNIISALHKSMRGSDPDAALYWAGRMMEAGEDPRYITRRLIRFAAEDIGLADPQALALTVAAHQAAQLIGMPESNVIVAQAVAYLALAPKSAAVSKAYNRVAELIRTRPNEPVPLHIRNAPTKFMKAEGNGEGYIYPPDHGYPVKPQPYLPAALAGEVFLHPNDYQPRGAPGQQQSA